MITLIGIIDLISKQITITNPSRKLIVHNHSKNVDSRGLLYVYLFIYFISIY